MADLSHPSSRAAWIRGIAKRLPEVLPGFRVMAEDWLADRSRIDLLGAAANEVVVVDFAEPGRELETLGRLLAHTQWAEPRLEDWLKLAPELGFPRDAPVRGVLVGPSLCAETLTALEALPRDRVLPIHARWAGGDVWLEAATDEGLGTGRESPPMPPTAAPAEAEPAQVASPSPFRTGLTDADLGLSPAELAELE